MTPSEGETYHEAMLPLCLELNISVLLQVRSKLAVYSLFSKSAVLIGMNLLVVVFLLRMTHQSLRRGVCFRALLRVLAKMGGFADASSFGALAVFTSPLVVVDLALGFVPQLELAIARLRHGVIHGHHSGMGAIKLAATLCETNVPPPVRP